ncbi:MAG: phospholipid-binding protein MlaC [Gammaproteobacteria bacterium]
MKSLKYLKFLLLFGWVFLSQGVAYALENPVQFMERITKDILTTIEVKHDEFKRNDKALYAFMEGKMAPYGDFEEMSQWIAGRRVWGTASEATKKAFMLELKTMIIRTYGRAINAYRDQKIEFRPLRTAYENKNRILVASVIIEPGKQPIAVDYKLLRRGQGWKVYDIIIEGVSLIQGYTAQFSDLIKQKGLEAAVDKIRAHNQGPE